MFFFHVEKLYAFFSLFIFGTNSQVFTDQKLFEGRGKKREIFSGANEFCCLICFNERQTNKRTNLKRQGKLWEKGINPNQLNVEPPIDSNMANIDWANWREHSNNTKHLPLSWTILSLFSTKRQTFQFSSLPTHISQYRHQANCQLEMSH